MDKETNVVVKNYDIQSASDMTELATNLKRHIVSHNLFTEIRGKNYVEVEGWQFAGGMLGIFPRVSSVQNLSDGEEIKWLAEVELIDIRTNEIIGRGFALCSNKESKKKNFDEYAVLSMAETRAVGKAYRTCIAWIMKVAGYEGVPSEEMQSNLVDTEQYVTKLESSKSKEELINSWNSLPADAKKQLMDIKNKMKEEYENN